MHSSGHSSGHGPGPRLGAIALAAAMLLTVTASAHAQEPLAAGDSLRITMASQTDVYTFVRADSRTLYVRDGRSTLELPLPSIDRVERRAPRPPGRTGRIILGGVGGGVAAGLLIGTLTAEDPGPDCWLYCYSRGEQIAAAALLMGGLGLVLGGMAALSDANRPYWEPVDSGALSVGVTRAPDSGIGLAVRWSWPWRGARSRP